MTAQIIDLLERQLVKLERARNDLTAPGSHVPDVIGANLAELHRLEKELELACDRLRDAALKLAQSRKPD